MVNILQLHSSPMLVRSCLKSCILGFRNMWIKNFQISNLGWEKEEEPEIKLPTFSLSQRMLGNSRQTPTFVSLTMPKPLTVWIIINCSVQLSSFQSRSHVWLFATPWTVVLQASLSIITPRVYSNSCPLSQWCHPPTSSSVIPFSSCLQSFPASGPFQMSQFFPSGGQSIGVSASTSVLPLNTQDWSPLGWTGWISLQAKGLSRVFSNTIVWKHQFFGNKFSF